MNSGELTAEQIDVLLRGIAPTIRFLQQLHHRMTAQQFPAIDPLRIRALCALDQLELLRQTLEQLAKSRIAHDEYVMAAKSKREFKRRQRDQRNG